ncbi:hypothetical protein F0L74_20225 [Chitinophaga agrisoli]|uniref:Uncharacterized protein n=1 Tax=Chitinophaga agrisoli TaxID=2607653 RepID=A0A5B2VG77_9BACT|nr:hypothetical protein [Chitinophaga agrisoli]KAA2238553.1 hypothetical protein F0L74_20225 [Chitinophaga agrisoli]
MSKNTLIGIGASVIVIVSAFLPWLTIESKQLVFTGLQTTGSSFGEPGKLNIVLALIAAVLFALQKVWAQRLNIFITAFLMAWTFRNFILFARCEMGECPEKEIGLYLSLIAAVVAFLSVLVRKKNGKVTQ